MAKRLNQHLTMHHTIEEVHIFPILAKKMPQFAVHEHKEGAEVDEEAKNHIESHKGIHDGLEELGSLVQGWTKDQSTYSPTAMRECLDGFRKVLFDHLDKEVEDLKGDNLKKHGFTLAELDAMPI